MLPGVRLKELAIHVNSSDDSYMPKVVAISVGNSTDNLKQIKSINVARYSTYLNVHVPYHVNHITVT